MARHGLTKPIEILPDNRLKSDQTQIRGNDVPFYFKSNFVLKPLSKTEGYLWLSGM